MTTSPDPFSITVTLPLRPELIPDPEAEKRYAQGLTATLREAYPDSILEVCWCESAEQVQIDYQGDRDDVREEVLALTERFSRLWLLALQTVRNYLDDRLACHARILPTGPVAAQLVIQETRLDGQQRILHSRRLLRSEP